MFYSIAAYELECQPHKQKVKPVMAAMNSFPLCAFTPLTMFFTVDALR